MLAGGEEYTGRYGLTVRQLREWHLPRAEVLAGSGADVLALETVPDLDEAEALVGVARELDVPCWLTYTIDGGQTRAGQPLRDAFAVAAGAAQVIAVGVNCCAPSDVAAAVSLAREVTGKPAIAYPNSGETWDGVARAWQGVNSWQSTTGPSLTELAPQWVARGARIVGGCCRVTPAGIADISRLVAAG
jgi:homocysteine S-methyltransferase